MYLSGTRILYPFQYKIYGKYDNNRNLKEPITEPDLSFSIPSGWKRVGNDNKIISSDLTNENAITELDNPYIYKYDIQNNTLKMLNKNIKFVYSVKSNKNLTSSSISANATTHYVFELCYALTLYTPSGLTIPEAGDKNVGDIVSGFLNDISTPSISAYTEIDRKYKVRTCD